jgi:hypothetical protein
MFIECNLKLGLERAEIQNLSLTSTNGGALAPQIKKLLRTKSAKDLIIGVYFMPKNGDPNI